MLRIGIISYLPDNNEIRKVRYNSIKSSLNSLMEIIPKDSKIYVNSQNYNEEEYFSEINYIKNNQGIGQGFARNELLREFYKSNDDFIMLTDDDIIFESNNNIKELLEYLHINSNVLFCIDAISGIDIPYRTDKYLDNLYNLDLENNLIFKPMPFKGIGGVLILRNLKKYYNIEFYYENKICEDIIFRIDNLSKINSYQCKNLLFRSSCSGKFSTFEFEDDNQQRKCYNKNTRKIFDERSINRINGKRDFRGVQKNLLKREIIIPIEKGGI